MADFHSDTIYFRKKGPHGQQFSLEMPQMTQWMAQASVLIRNTNGLNADQTYFLNLLYISLHTNVQCMPFPLVLHSYWFTAAAAHLLSHLWGQYPLYQVIDKYDKPGR